MTDAAQITGRVTGSYQTAGEETVWLIAWDDRQRRPLTDVDCAETFREGQRVRLVGNRLEGAGA